jgi:hypothetical protein
MGRAPDWGRARAAPEEPNPAAAPVERHLSSQPNITALKPSRKRNRCFTSILVFTIFVVVIGERWLVFAHNFINKFLKFWVIVS